MMHPAVCHFPFGGRGTLDSSSVMLTISWRTAWKSLPLLLLNAPGTFSQTMYLGLICVPVLPAALSLSLISFMIRICSRNRLLREPSRPSRFPAMLMSWHGEPPAMMVTGSKSAPFNLLMSPRCFISGKFFVVTSIGNGSISLAHIGLIPNIDPANSKPPLPENKDPIVISCFICSTQVSFRTSGSACGFVRFSFRRQGSSKSPYLS